MTTGAQLDNRIAISREELYLQVWQEPMTKVAPRYGLSDVGLAKVCRKHHIPRPPVGYWAKAGVGHHVEQAPLPELDDESLQEITIFRRQFFGQSIDISKSAAERIVVNVPERLIDPHPLIVQTKQAIESKRASGDGKAFKTASALNISASIQASPRALRIMNAAIRKWEELGGVVKIDAERGNETQTRFTFGDDSVGVSMFEETDRIERDPDKHQYYRDWEYKYSGRLVLEVFARWGGDFRRRWADGKKQRLELVLGSFIEGLQKWIVHEREHRLEVEIEERQRTKAKQVRIRREELAKQFAQQAKDLEHCAANFAQSEEIRRYLKTFETKIAEGLIRPTNPKTFPEWMEWAKWYADYLDPITPTSMREDYSVSRQNVPVTDIEWTRRTKLIIEALGVTDTDELYRVDRQTVMNVGDSYNSNEWSEIGRALEGLGYDVSDKRYQY